MQRKKLALLFALLVVVSALSGCARQPQDQALGAQVAALAESREKGVNAADGQTYLATVLPSDAVLIKEESNLIRAAANLGITDYDIDIKSVTRTDDGCTASLTQAYTAAGKRRACSYTAAFISEGGKLYYDGPSFERKQNDRVHVFYLAGRETLAGQILDAETGILDRMRDQLDFTPTGAISVKLYEDQSVFLQSIKLDLPQWVGGWHEYGEAVKTSVGAYGTDVENYRSMLCHESTHRMVSELSGDNAAYWLQEGLAGVYEDKLLQSDAPALSAAEASQTITPFAEQKSIDLEKLGIDDREAVTRYYASAKAYAAFLVEEYGWSKVKQALDYMTKFELIPVTGAEKMAETNERTDAALAQVFGFSGDEAIQSAFENWLEKIK